MTARFFQTVFTAAVRAQQRANGSRASYAHYDNAATEPDTLSQQERDFITARDSFYLATITETGWPYIQHRGGPPGFMKILDARTLGFADFRGNRQYVSVGNLSTNDRVAFFFMDYPNRARLKLLGRVRVLRSDDNPTLAARLCDPTYRAAVERYFLVDIEAFDWNCAQHITSRFILKDGQPRV